MTNNTNKQTINPWRTWDLHPQPQTPQSVEATVIELLLNQFNFFKVIPGNKNNQQLHLRATPSIKAMFTYIL